MAENTCSYCKKPLGSSYLFSYGIPGIKREYACDKTLCKITRRFRRKRNAYLISFVKRLYELIDTDCY